MRRLQRFGPGAGLGAALVFAMSCARGDRVDADWPGIVDTLSSGTVVVRNPSTGIWKPGSAWTVTEELRLGTAQGEGPELFGQVRDIEVDALGRIYVLDGQANEIRVFDVDGSFVRAIGGPGEGPGELQGATGMAWSPDWRLWVEDPRNSRYTEYDTTGSLVTTRPRRLRWRSFSWSGRFDDAGNLYVEDRRLDPEGSRGWLILTDSTLTARDSFPLPAYEQLIYELVEGGITRMAAIVPFSPSLRWQVADDGTLWFGTSDAYRFYQRRMEGDTMRIVERAYQPIPVTPAEREAALDEDFLREMAGAGATVDPGVVPVNRPAWTSFFLDPAGYLWVIPQTRDSTSTSFDVFGPDGRYLGRTTIAGAIQGLFPGPIVRGAQLYAVTQDEFGVQYVIRARIGARDADPRARPDSPG